MIQTSRSFVVSSARGGDSCAHLVPGYLQAQIDRLPKLENFAALVLHDGPQPTDPARGRLLKGSDSRATAVARLRGVEPLARGFEVGDQPVHEAPDASRSVTFRGVTAAAVSQRLGVNRETIYRLCARGELPHLRVGSSLRLLLADVIASLARSGS